MTPTSRRLAHAVLLLPLVSFAAPQVSVDSGPKPPARPLSFLDHALASIRPSVATTTTLVANVNLFQRVPGLTRIVKSDARIVFRAPDFLLQEIKSPYPYTVLVSNRTVQVWIPASNDYDTRPLAPGETIWEDFLGVGVFANERDWNFTFRDEGNLHVLTATLRPAARATLASNQLANAHRAVRRSLWLDPHRHLVVRTYRLSLLGEETTLEFRDQWRNMGLPLP
ncbi:MAG: hypothetical protein N2595_00115 [bacterium]|nr:hypothetical protein [bacterium]